MGSKTVFYSFEIDAPYDAVSYALKRSLSLLGGTMQEIGQSIMIQQGTAGVSNAFAADFTANVELRQTSERKYEIFCTINWKMNTLSWICLVVGFFVLGILWIIPLLYLFIDPSTAYQQALYRIPQMVQTQ